MNKWWALDGGLIWRLVAQILDDCRVAFNGACEDLEPWQIVSYTLSSACFFIWLREILETDCPLSTRIQALVIFFMFNQFTFSNLRIFLMKSFVVSSK